MCSVRRIIPWVLGIGAIVILGSRLSYSIVDSLLGVDMFRRSENRRKSSRSFNRGERKRRRVNLVMRGGYRL